MQVEFENHGYIKITFFSASFSFHVPVSYDNAKANIDVWRRFADTNTQSITIFSSHLMTVSPNTPDIDLIKKDYDIVSFMSPVYCFQEKYSAGGETKIPFVYCKQAFEKVVEYLEKIDSSSED